MELFIPSDENLIIQISWTILQVLINTRYRKWVKTLRLDNQTNRHMNTSQADTWTHHKQTHEHITNRHMNTTQTDTRANHKQTHTWTHHKQTHEHITNRNINTSQTDTWTHHNENRGRKFLIEVTLIDLLDIHIWSKINFWISLPLEKLIRII